MVFISVTRRPESVWKIKDLLFKKVLDPTSIRFCHSGRLIKHACFRFWLSLKSDEEFTNTGSLGRFSVEIRPIKLVAKNANEDVPFTELRDSKVSEIYAAISNGIAKVSDPVRSCLYDVFGIVHNSWDVFDDRGLGSRQLNGSSNS
jgi:hypothetical protein